MSLGRHLQALWRKELSRQKWIVLASTGLLLSLLGLEWSYAARHGAIPSLVQAAGTTVMLSTVALALLLGHRSVVREYQSKSQLFLETLPVQRWEGTLARFSFGLAVQLLLMLSSLGLILLAAGETDARFAAIVSARTAGYVFFLWSAAFLLGTLGRLRWLAYGTLFVAVHVATQRGVDWLSFGPIALVDPGTFAYERESFPAAALAQTVAIGGGFTLASFLLSLLHEGSMAEALSRRASTREKVGFWVLLAAQLQVAVVLVKPQHREPFELTGTTVATSGEHDVQVMYGLNNLELRGRVILTAVERLASRLKQELGVTAPPALRVSHNASLKRAEIRTASSELAAGVLLEVNLSDAGWSTDELLGHLAHGVFGTLSEYRAQFEPNHWFLDGFSTYWAPAPEPRNRDVHWLRVAMLAKHIPLTSKHILEWERTLERIGEQAAGSLGFALVEVLEARHGRELTRELARTLLTQPTVVNGFDWLVRSHLGLPQLLEARTGEPWASFVAAFLAQLDRESQRLQGRTSELATASARLEVESSELGKDLVYSLAGLAPKQTRECKLLHTALPAYDAAVPTPALTPEPIEWPAGENHIEGRLEGRYQPGQRLLAVIDCRDRKRKETVRLVATRVGG